MATLKSNKHKATFTTEGSKYLTDKKDDCLETIMDLSLFLQEGVELRCLKYQIEPPKAIWDVIDVERYKKLMNMHGCDEDTFKRVK